MAFPPFSRKCDGQGEGGLRLKLHGPAAVQGAAVQVVEPALGHHLRRRGRAVVGDVDGGSAVLPPQLDPQLRGPGVAHAVGQALPHGQQEDEGVFPVLRQLTGEMDPHAQGPGILNEPGQHILLRRVFAAVPQGADRLPQQPDGALAVRRALPQQLLAHRRQTGAHLVVELRLGRQHLLLPGQRHGVVRQALQLPGDGLQFSRLALQLQLPVVQLGEIGEDHLCVGGPLPVPDQGLAAVPDPSVGEQVVLQFPGQADDAGIRAAAVQRLPEFGDVLQVLLGHHPEQAVHLEIAQLHGAPHGEVADAAGQPVHGLLDGIAAQGPAPDPPDLPQLPQEQQVHPDCHTPQQPHGGKPSRGGKAQIDPLEGVRQEGQQQDQGQERGHVQPPGPPAEAVAEHGDQQAQGEDQRQEQGRQQ